jgi:hypothetical protein
MDPSLIPELPEDITSLSDDELAELRTTLLDLEQKIYDADEETVGDASNAEVMAAYEQVVEAIRTLNGEQAKRGEEQQAVADKMTELRGDIRDTEPTPEPEPEAEEAEKEEEPEEVEAEIVEEPEPVLASSRPFRTRKVVRDEEPEPEDNGSLSLVAASDVPGFSSGMQITQMQLAEALIAKRRAFVSAPEGYREQVVVASSHTHYPEERFIGDEDPLGDSKIRKAVGSPGSVKIEPLVAAGGICAPTDVRYAWDVLGSTSTPVWNSLPKFGAARGGIRFPVIPTIANITTATTTVTAAQDAAGGTSAVKGCQEVTCPSFSEVLVDIVAACLQFPNLTARTYPEMVAGWNELLAIALAQEIESKILTSIQAGSTDVTDIAEGTTVPTDLGAIGQLYPVLLQAASRLRNNMRLDPNAALRALIPAWALDVLVADYYRRHSVDPTEKAKNDFVTALNRIGIQPTFYLDGSASGGQVMGAQTAAALVTYPSLAEIFLFTEGTWLGLDGGTLDLGVVRDSTLNSTNKYQVFAEQFLNVAKVSGESVALRIPLGPTGAAALDKTTTFATSM